MIRSHLPAVAVRLNAQAPAAPAQVQRLLRRCSACCAGAAPTAQRSACCADPAAAQPHTTQNHSKPLKRPISGLSGRVIWPLSGPKRTKTRSTRLKHTQKCSRYHLRTLLPVTCCTHLASKSLKTTQKAHFGPFRTRNIAVTQPSGGQNTLHAPQTYPNMLQIPPMYIATSHMLHLYGLEIAQNRSNPPYSTIWPIWPILGLSGRAI